MIILLTFAALFSSMACMSAQALAVEKNGQTSQVKLEAPVAGHLVELNGEYKLRASETIYEPGGYIGEHHHSGPGIRYVAEGELTYVQGPKTTIYKKGTISSSRAMSRTLGQQDD
jgi:quercetin dioxygenase-like cupin family protein